MNKKYILDWIKVGHEEGDKDTGKIKKIINNKIAKCESYKAERNCFEIRNEFLKESHLENIYKKDWIQDMKVLDLSANQIEDISEILSNCKNLK